MEISQRSVGAVTVLDLTGHLAVGPDERELIPFRSAIFELIDAGCRDIVVNLRGLTSIDARGLGELAIAMKTVHRAGGRLTLAAAAPRVARILAVTRLDRAFEWCDKDVEERPQVREPECCDAVPGTN